MSTNPEILNPYLRSLLARELLGYRKTYWRNQTVGLNNYAYVVKRQVCRRCFGRFDSHLRDHGLELLAGNAESLDKYPASFAGH